MILNKTKNIVITAEMRVCRSIPSKLRGLMFSRKITDTGLVFVFDKAERRGLHMLFVFFPIDLVFLDSRKRIIEIKEHFLPFTVYYPREKAKYVLELPDGAVKRSGTEIGDFIMF